MMNEATKVPTTPSGGPARSRALALFLALALVAVFWMGGATGRDRVEADGTDAETTLRFLEYSGELFGHISNIVAPAVVYIEARQKEKGSELYNHESGSGVILRLEGIDRPVVVTNLHVVADAVNEDVEVMLADNRVLTPKQIWIDRDTDLAVLDLGESDLPTARISKATDVHVGQWVLAIGSPFGLMQSVTHGIISATDRRQLGLPQSMRIKEFIQTDAAINPGSSGGPLVNLRAEVIGINTAIASHTGGSSGVGFAIPANIVKRVAEELVQHGRVRRAYLGVEFPRRFDRDEALSLGLPQPRGALVATIAKGTPAANAGLQPGDVILEFDGRAVEDDNHLINLVGQETAGTRVNLTVWRDKQTAHLPVTLGDWTHQVSEESP